MLGAALAISLLAGACSTTPAEDADATSVELDLSAVALASDTVSELGRVRFTGIDPRADLSELEVVLTDEVAEVPLLLFQDDDGVYAPAPLAPATPGQGGPTELELRNGDAASVTLELQLTGLPPAPGAWDAAIDGLKAELEARAAAAGTDLETVMATPVEQLPDDLVVARLVAGIVDDGTSDDLESVLDAPDSPELSGDQRALLDALVARLDPLALITPSDALPGLADAATDDAAVEAAAAGEVSAAAVGGVGAMGGVGVRPAPPTGGPVLADAGSCRNFGLRIGNADRLAETIKVGIDAQIPEGSPVDTLFKDLGTLGNYTNEVPVLSNVMGVLGTMIETVKLWHNADAGRYPSALTQLRVGVSTDTFNEDFTEPGEVVEVGVTATSTGYNAAEDLASIAAAIADALLGVLVNKTAADGLDDAEDLAFSFSGRWRQAIMSRVMAELGEEFLTWCPQTWDVDITGPQWVDLVGVARIDTNRPAQTYQPNSVGDGVLRVRADPEAFSGATTSREVPISIGRLQVIATPEVIEVDEPGRTALITVEVRNADTTTLFWEAQQGRWNDGRGADTNDGGERPLVTPTDPKAYPFLVTVYSTSETGLRAKADGSPNDTVEIKLRDLVVSPPGATIGPGETVSYTATDPDGNPVEVRWEATGGEIGDDGQYVAGDEKGTFTVTATAVDDSDRTVTVQVTISEIEPCTFRFSYDGSVLSEEEGGYSGSVSGTASFSIDEYTGDTGRPEHGGMTALNHADGQTRVEAVTALILGDQTPQFALVHLLVPEDPGIPLGTTGSYARPGGIQVHPSGAEESFEFTGDFGITITESVLGQSNGVPVIQRLAGTFESLGQMEVVDPWDVLSGSVVVTGGEFSVDREACSDFVP